ncbi:EAL domain-containing protein [Sedimenticola selenatireducens]|uniref:EAL domain-containing protein n=1 Tax=Sedimenticola selenatireducens TaxID=191960 RepID=UPI0004B7418E|nr:EAL domain-containing protein [Sedimenticola selenatireducens]
MLPGLRKLICHIRIRRLLLMVLGLLCAVAISAIAWNSIDVIRQHQAASRLGLVNLLADKSLKLTTELAVERGLTSTLLAMPDKLDPDQLVRLNNQRKKTDNRYQEFSQILQKHHAPEGATPIEHAYPAMQQIHQQLQQLRREVDRVFLGDRDPQISLRWLGLMTGKINDISKLQRSIMAPTEETGHVINYGQMLRDSFYTMAEYAGRERATIGRAIALERALDEGELRQLVQFREAMEYGEKKSFEVLDFYPETPEIKAALAHYHSIFKGSFEQLRNQVLEAGRRGMPYPVTELVWFSEASRSIDTITAISEAASIHNQQDIDIIQQQANQTVASLLATILLVFMLFIATYFITYRRILSPLNLLENAARTIESGDLNQPFLIDAQDEFGRLGQSFESMRLSLLADRQKRELAEQELRKLHQAVEQSVSSLVITDAKGVTEYVNPRFELTTGFRQEEVIGKRYNKTRSGRTPKAVYKQMWRTIKSGHIWEGELLNRKKSGELFWELVSISPVRNKQGEISNYIGMHHDITQRKVMEERLNFLAYHDELTGLPNRSLLTDRFTQLISHSQRHQKKVALLILDLNRFKLINDSLGHETGDRVLVEVGNRLTKLARTSDTVSRYGGAEFVILLTEIESANTVTDFARRISREISKPITVGDRLLHVSCTIGVALWPEDGKTLDNLLSNADAAMYQAKKRNGEKLQFFTEELNHQVQQRMEMENGLRNAVQGNELELYYQPQFNQRTNRITGMEALLRWHHPHRGLISPDRFIPLAEETGLILPIGEWVLETACLQLKQFQRNGYPDLVVAVNVSVRQLEGQDMTDTVHRIISKTAINPSSLEIEITESTMMEDPDRMIEALSALKKLGVRLALDDFGTGHSSLSYLQRFPFDKIKIDRAFIRNITRSEDDAAIAMTIGAMAKSLKLEVIAEGVETEEQMKFLKRCGCDNIQGYLISKPIPAMEFGHLLAQHQIQPFWLTQNPDPQLQ